MKKAGWLILLTGIVLSVLVITPCVNAEYLTKEKETLRGVKSFHVTVDNLRPDAKGHGLTVEKLKRDVELECRLAGITISEDSPVCLYVNVNTLHLEISEYLGEHFVYNIFIEFKQKVSLLRKPDLSCYAGTWWTLFTGTVPADEMEQEVRKNLKDLLDKFLNDYLAVNPKK